MNRQTQLVGGEGQRTSRGRGGRYMDVVVTIIEFIHQLKARGYADNTITSYRMNIGHFKQYLINREITDLKKVTHRTILDYQAKVMAEPLSMESKALKIRAVKRLFEYLTDTHRLLINPCEGIVETSRKNRRIQPVLTIEEIKRLLNQPNLSLKTGIRDRAVMEVLYSTGIRLDELLSLEVYHADLKEKVLYIRKGKGRKQRVVPLGKGALTYLKEYLHKIRSHHGRKRPKERALFLNHSGNPLSGGAISAFLRTYRISSGINKPVSPHTFRRTCATHLLQQGPDIRYIQELLGHKRLSTTQQYTKVMPTEVKNTHNTTHPNRKKQDED
jgi:integrase/recombinase XerD